MKEETVRRFFEGQASAKDLEADAAGSVESHLDEAGVRLSKHRITDMEENFTVTPAHLIQLVDTVLRGELSLEALDATVFCLVASDRFDWHAEEAPSDRIPEALFLLGTPEINYPLTDTVLGKIRHYLVSGHETLSETDGHKPSSLRETQQAKSWDGV